jgi:hypothetical protein
MWIKKIMDNSFDSSWKDLIQLRYDKAVTRGLKQGRQGYVDRRLCKSRADLTAENNTFF